MSSVRRVIGNVKIAENIFALVFDASDIAARAVPGQFVHIDCGLSLRRPISICDIDGSFVKIVFEVKGGGTKWLSERRHGDTLDVLGAFGNGFPEISGRVLLVGGGIGAAPLLYAAVRLGIRCDAALGFAGAAKAILTEEFAAVCGSVRIAAEDGSLGSKGFVTDLIASGDYSAIFACGPRPMLKAAVERGYDLKVPVYVSAEERMACGIGVCLVCACAVAGGGYKRVCVDGPVFSGDEIKW
ncbi:MAG: dihydroorotate dehydrogenase electron transfer subunit [Oscillospiraceae bacterium]|jgi:dihydroorotate dehydrogenase electron transfer subunit|nr:dihydroorotate dehydrogenase electron transfer subunit [Oscillospiraceae bacterium]